MAHPSIGTQFAWYVVLLKEKNKKTKVKAHLYHYCTGVSNIETNRKVPYACRNAHFKSYCKASSTSTEAPSLICIMDSISLLCCIHHLHSKGQAFVCFHTAHHCMWGSNCNIYAQTKEPRPLERVILRHSTEQKLGIPFSINWHLKVCRNHAIKVCIRAFMHSMVTPMFGQASSKAK